MTRVIILYLLTQENSFGIIVNIIQWIYASLEGVKLRLYWKTIKIMNSNTNVLLLIIPNPSSTILAHSLFYRLFSVYGEVVKILIFEKARVWKAFVEMGNEQQAQQAQKHLDQTEVSDEVIMNVYFSNLRSVTFLNNNCGGVDYR